MITINVLLKVKAEKEQDYLAFLDDMVQKSRQDDGCISFTVDILERLPDFPLGQHVQSDGGFIQIKNFRVVEQRDGQFCAHFLP